MNLITITYKDGEITLDAGKICAVRWYEETKFGVVETDVIRLGLDTREMYENALVIWKSAVAASKE